MGHARIYVLCNKNGDPADEGGKTQCATIDRIPFMMKRKDVVARHGPEEEHGEEASV